MTALLAPLLVLAAAPGPSTAFYYAADPPVEELDLYDWVVVEPDHLSAKRRAAFSHAKLYAYVGAGEVAPSRPYSAEVKAEWRLGSNPAWKSWVMDLGNEQWRRFLVAQLIGPLVAQGYGGVFLDALDSHQLIQLSPERRTAQLRGLIDLVQRIKAAYPQTSVLLNRGFEVVPELKELIVGVAVESIYAGYDGATKKYRPVPDADRVWLMERVGAVRALGLPVIAVDYLAPASFDGARDLAAKLAALGLVPWIADAELSRLGVGLFEVLPRKVLLLFDGKQHRDVAYSEVHRLVAMPLEYAGLVPVYADVHASLPEGHLAGRYAGIVAWIGAFPVAAPAALRRFFERAIADRVPVVFLGAFPGEFDDVFLRGLGVKRGLRIPNTQVEIEKKSDIVGFEAPLRPRARSFYPLTTGGPGFESFLTLRRGEQRMEAVGRAPWGGWALLPHVVEEGADQDVRWIIDPFRFFDRTLRLGDRPIIDPTTENGRRVSFIQIDGDGEASRAERPGNPYSAQVVLEHIQRHPMPHAVSIIEGETSPQGLYPDSSAALEGIARQLFALPQVEIASHGYLHPLRWHAFELGLTEPGLHLAVPGAIPNVHREITGSIEYIRAKLAPKDKPVKLFLWTGNAVPGEVSLADARQAGVGNLNGGDTEVTKERSSLTRVSPMTRSVGPELQVYAAAVYQEPWGFPYYGFRKVIETFEMTGTPRRLKPIDVYYHYYLVSKPAGKKALDQVYDWVERSGSFPIFPSAWVKRAQAFQKAMIARTWDGRFLASGLGSIHTLRLPVALGWPAPDRSAGIAGVRDLPEGRYVHTDGRSLVTLALGQAPPTRPYLMDSDAVIEEWAIRPDGFEIKIEADRPIALSLGGPRARACRWVQGSRTVAPKVVGQVAVFRLNASQSGHARLICR